MNKSFKHLPQNKRKKILLICDDIRVHSGVATVGKEIVLHTAHHFNWIQMGGAIKHPDTGKLFDISADVNKMQNIDDSSVKIFCTDQYGNEQILRSILKAEKPDAIMLITDPRYFVPHGLKHDGDESYIPLSEDDEGMLKYRKEFLNIKDNKEVDFVLFFNSRNIRRKQIPDAMMAFRSFLDSLPKEKADKCRFILHTEGSTDAGFICCKRIFV